MKRKKRTILISMIIAAAFITPLVVWAIVYHSRERVNSFQPASVDIQVQEKGLESELGDELPNTLTIGNSRTVDKPVAIYDTHTREEEALRIALVPMWLDENDNVCGTLFNLGTPVMNADETALTYTDGDKVITLKLASGWKKNGWVYHDPNNADDPGDGYFYYSGKLKSGQLTPRLLDKVELSEAAYALTENNTYRLRIDVLADAIQTSGGAESQRGWEP